jgi:hypothetical protein
MASRTSRSLGTAVLLAAVGLALGTGCVAKPDVPLQQLAYSGQYGHAREHAAKGILVPKSGKADLKDREYILSRMRYALASMADGYYCEDPVFVEVYERLSEQGINDKNRGAARLINEDIQQWKGEPFEQAIMLSYLSMYYAGQGSWDNARAAAMASQFRLKERAAAKDGKPRTNQEVIDDTLAAERQPAPADKAAAGDKAAAEKDDFGNYLVRDTDFCLGILLDGIASQQIGKRDEAASKFSAVAAMRPDLAGLASELAKGDYNDVLVVSWGQGPQKTGTGPDRSVVAWQRHTPCGEEKLLVTQGGGTAKSYPLVTDVNVMAENHMWNSLQDLRKAKSVVGSVMVGAGAGVAAYGLQKRDSGTAIAGLAIALAGAALKAGAHADTRYCDVMPQRFYLVPVKTGRTGGTVALEVEGQPASRMVLAGFRPPAEDKPAGLRYVNLLSRVPAAPEWASSGRILYNNDALPATVERPWPYILGGDCVRKPTQEALSYYQKSGHLTNLTIAELQDLYRQEGILFEGADRLRTRHVLEGGRSLEAPSPGTAGFARLFGQRHAPYVPKSPAVRQLAASLKSSPSAPARDLTASR